MKNKPDYRGFVLHLQFWDEHNVCYSLSDMVELAHKYHTPIPEGIRQ